MKWVETQELQIRQIKGTLSEGKVCPTSLLMSNRSNTFRPLIVVSARQTEERKNSQFQLSI